MSLGEYRVGGRGLLLSIKHYMNYSKLKLNGCRKVLRSGGQDLVSQP